MASDVATLRQPADTQSMPYLTPLLDRLDYALKKFTVDNFHPTLGTVLVKQAEPDRMTDGGIHLPDRCEIGKAVGVVVRAHPDDEKYRAGDVVYFRGGSEVAEFRDGQYVILQHQGDVGDEILGKVVVD